MKRVIRSRVTGKFVKDGEWTDQLEEATDFASTPEAIRKCIHDRLKDTEIVLSFDDPQLDICIPIRG